MITEKRKRLTRSMQTASLFLATILGATLYIPSVAAQRPVTEQVRNAAERSKTAAAIINTIMSLPAAEGIPREVIEKAEAVAVIPHVVKVKMIFQSTTKGYGVISRRVPGGWTFPAYYGFSGVHNDASFIGGEAYDVIVLFMNDKMVDYFQKGRFEFERERKANGGTVGTDIQKAVLDRANVFVYILSKGKLSGLEVANNFWGASILNPDNNINNVLYRMKGRDVLAGKPINSQALPEDVSAFQRALVSYSVRQ